MTDGQAEFGRGYGTAGDDIHEWADRMTREWYALGIVNAEQMLALTWLVHELEKRTLRR